MMKLKHLSIAPDRPYATAGKDNPYIAEISVEWNKNNMKVQLSEEVAARILDLCEEEIVQATKVEIQSFRSMVQAQSTKTIEHEEQNNE